MNDAADRIAALLRDIPADDSMNPDAREMTRRQAHALLDAALDLAEAVHKIDDTATVDQSVVFALDAAMTLAGGAGRVLAEAVAGWTALVGLPARRLTFAEWDRLAKEDPVAWRKAAGACLIGDAPMPSIVAIQLHDALDDLDSERDAPAILTPPPAGRKKGKQPRRRQWAEQLLMTWIVAEIAHSGRKAGDVEDQAAKACSLNVKSLEDMKKRWRERDTKEVVDATLAAARTLWAGGDVPLPWPREVQALSLGWGGGMEAIVSALKEASQSRPHRESRDA